jgi:RNA polymerase sigma-70 factor, ECF subfamily
MHRGDAEAARALWEGQAGRLTALARVVTGSHADALDAVQEAFIAVLGLPAAEIAGIGDAGAYLAGAVRGRALNIVRASARRERHERRGEGGAALPPLRLVGAADEDPALEAALGGLAMETREAVALKHIAGLTFDQMAGVLGVARATVASRYYSGIEQLRAALQAAPRSASQEVVRA